MVNVGFGMNFVMLALVWIAIKLHGSQAGMLVACEKFNEMQSVSRCRA
jgi:hypothetical protein